MAQSGFYAPSSSQFVPVTVRVLYTVNEEEKEVNFTTSSASSYPVVLRNRIITACKI